MRQKLRKIVKNQAGLTLVELVIALAITGAITATVTMITFQVFDGEARANNHMDAISRVQNAGRQVSRDASMAQVIVGPEEGDEDGFPLTLTWTEWEDNQKHNVVYKIQGNELWRDYYLGEIEGTPDNSYRLEYIIGAYPDNPSVPVTYCERDPQTSQLTFTLTAVVGVGSQQISETRQYTAMPRSAML
jgi:type II secretory pathway pseudopilin PulG